MLAKPDTFNQAFIDFATIVEAPVLEIGCAYGVATIPALEKGASVIANDLDERHLTLLKSYAPPSSLERLQLKPGRMPEDLDFPQESLGAVLASRVLNFVHPTKLEQSFHLIFKWLKTELYNLLYAELSILVNVERSFLFIYMNLGIKPVSFNSDLLK